MQKKTQFKITDLSRFMLYMIGHRPDEFGLVPDKEGRLTLKEILRALHEEPGWRYVREIHLREVLLGKDRSLFEWEGERIRAVERRWRLNLSEPGRDVPKILFVGVRRRAHPYVMEKGLSSPQGYLVLSPDRTMALKIAERRDPKPVILEITTALARSEGVAFYPFGDLFLAPLIPSSSIAGPPLSEEDRLAREERKIGRAKKEQPPPVVDFTPGSFVLEPGRDPDRSRQKGRKQRGWKESARKARREKG